MRSLITVAAFGIIGLFVVESFRWIDQKHSTPPPSPGALPSVPLAQAPGVRRDTPESRVHERNPTPLKAALPDVTLSFVYPDAPALMIENQSESLARDIKWFVALWNMDLPDRNDPLPIPVSIFDWLRPHSKGGPLDLFKSPLVAPLLNKGNRLFGSASVLCPECARGRTFIVYIVWGEGGWFSEIEHEKSGSVIMPSNFLKDTREAYFRQLEASIPQSQRIPIGRF